MYMYETIVVKTQFFSFLLVSEELRLKSFNSELVNTILKFEDSELKQSNPNEIKLQVIVKAFYRNNRLWAERFLI